MVFAFYVCSAIALLSTLRVVTNSNPIHALLYLVISLIAVAMIFFAVGAPFAGALEIIVYAGAIMVLFVFAVMMLNLGDEVRMQEQAWLRPRFWFGPVILSGMLLIQLVYVTATGELAEIAPGTHISPKAVGIVLYGPYLLAVELASVMLLAALVAAYHLGRADEKN